MPRPTVWSMVQLPATRYATTTDGVNLAYQAVGAGPPDIVFSPGFVTHVEYGWDEPRMAAFLDRLASFSRLCIFDQRGTGLSDPISLHDPPSLEVYARDIGAVMDAAGSERTVLLGASTGGAASMLFAATCPARVSALVLVNTTAQWTRGPDRATATERERNWGTGGGFELIAPSVAHDSDFLEWAARFERLAASPGTARLMRELFWAVDVSDVLPAIHVPTLVLHRSGNRMLEIEHARHLVEHIPDAVLVELPGEDFLFQVGDADALLDEIEEFVTGVRRGPAVDRVLSTILFTDIVGSTTEATRLGDRRWTELLDRYDALVRRQLTRFRGREIKTTGDGTLATFDGPARAIQCATAIRDGVRGLGVRIRAGIHTGEIALRGRDIAGIAVVVAQRVSALAGADEVLVSRTVVDLVAGSGILFIERGAHQLRGVHGEWDVFAVKNLSTPHR
jgi:pimeloyl-ACP methyl ester carboxylesterase